MKEVEIKTVDTILDKGVRVPIPTPFLFGKKQVNVIVRRPVMGNMLLISKLYEQMNVPAEFGDDFTAWHKLYTQHAGTVSRIVAVGILRGRVKVKLLSRVFAWYLRWHINSRELAQLAAILVTLSGVQDFLSTIKFLRAMKMTEPRKESPTDEGSQQDG